MKEEENERDLYSYQYLDIFFGMNISSIGKQTSTSNPESEQKTINEIKEKNHYLCNECKSLHLINFIYEEKKVNEEKRGIEEKIIIECDKKGKIDLDKFLADVPFLEDLDNYKYCEIHKDKNYEKIGFCSKCKKDLCQKCKEENACKDEEKHSFEEFTKKNEEIREKENLISKDLKNKYYDFRTTKNERSQKSEEKSGTNIITETLVDLVSLCKFLEALENSKAKIPSYIHYQNIINIYNYLYKKIKIKYCFSNKTTKIRLFGERFIENNRNKCSVIIDNELKKIEECEFYELKEPNTDLNIILLKEDDIIDLSYMFNDCEALKLIYKDYKWKINNVINMSYMFNNCKLLSFLPTFIYELDTSKVTDMSNMFNGCESLNEINDISDWNTSKVESMCKMFYGCKSLENLENILKWDTKNVTDMSYMFYNCSSLKNIDIKNKAINKPNWNTENVKNMSYMFYGCESLEQLPDNLTSWNISKVVYIQYMFYNCIKLIKVPDISNWETQNVAYMNDMFGNCSSLENLPEISKWKIDSLIDMNFFIEGCTSLKTFPDLSKWDKIKFKMGELLEKCFPNKKK